MSLADMIKTARAAQQAIHDYDQRATDKLVRAIGKAIFDNAEMLAREAVTETRMGVYEDKVAKNRGKSRAIWNDLKDKRSVDVIRVDDKNKIIEVAKPMGVVGSITPTTNPIVTPMANAMFALKGRNSIIVAPHPRAKRCSAHAVDLMNEALSKLGAPEGLIQIIREPSIELTKELMRSVDVVVATGGMAMVREAYSCGKPAFGVGAGNTPVIVDRNIDFAEAAAKIIAGRKYDNGIICSGEQLVIAHRDDYATVAAELVKAGGFLVSDSDAKARLRAILFPDNGPLNGHVVGAPCHAIADMAKISIPQGTSVLVVEVGAISEGDPLYREKMCPVLALTSYESFDEAIHIARTSLLHEGAGHTAAIHSKDDAQIERAGIVLPISRLVVNAPSSTTAGGSLQNGFAPTTTLGCGSWGNNSISENVTYKHLINVSRIGFFDADRRVPTDDEIWAE